MKKPQMILFDYGQTLLYEPDIDFLRGEEAVFAHVVRNPHGVTPQEACAFGLELFERYNRCRRDGFELHEWQTLKGKYEALGIELDISLPEAEEILWTAASPGACMPCVHELLSCLQRLGIRSGVISNIGWSGAALSRRLNRLLPENHFEFVIASSEYGLRKPDRFLFDLALQKAGLSPDDVWYCGDNLHADACGAHGAGIFPVLYECAVPDGRTASNAGAPADFPYLHIHGWPELMAMLETL